MHRQHRLEHQHRTALACLPRTLSRAWRVSVSSISAPRSRPQAGTVDSIKSSAEIANRLAPERRHPRQGAHDPRHRHPRGRHPRRVRRHPGARPEGRQHQRARGRGSQHDHQGGQPRQRRDQRAAHHPRGRQGHPGGLGPQGDAAARPRPGAARQHDHHQPGACSLGPEHPAEVARHLRQRVRHARQGSRRRHPGGPRTDRVRPDAALRQQRHPDRQLDGAPAGARRGDHRCGRVDQHVDIGAAHG